MLLYALKCTVEKLKGWYCSVKLYVQGLVQMFKGCFKCSRVGSNVLVLEVKDVGRAKGSEGNAQKLYLKWPLTARPIAKFNVLVCSYSVLIIADDVLVRIIRTDVINKLFKFIHSLIIVFSDRRAFVPIP
jgi:hypothetical protein